MDDKTKFHDARALLFDPVRNNMLVTRAALFEIGFRDIETVQTFEEFATHISKGDYDLVIAEGYNAGGDVARLTQRMRTGDVGVNPFVVTITTSWDHNSSTIRSLVNAGVDDLLLRPFSTNALRERINASVNGRKSFVVTGDYVGPDRRNDKNGRNGSADLFHPPNTLKASMEGDFEAMQMAKEDIGHQRQKMTRERIRALVMRIVVSIQIKLDDPEVGADIKLEEIDALARELRRQLRERGQADAIELASATIEMTTAALVPEGQSRQNLNLIKQLALGAFAAYAEGDGIERKEGEIGQTVAAMRNKLQERALQDWRAELACVK